MLVPKRWCCRKRGSLPSPEGILLQAPVVVLETSVQIQLGALELSKDVLAVARQYLAADFEGAGIARANKVGGYSSHGPEPKDQNGEDRLHGDCVAGWQLRLERGWGLWGLGVAVGCD